MNRDRVIKWGAVTKKNERRKEKERGVFMYLCSHRHRHRCSRQRQVANKNKKKSPARHFPGNVSCASCPPCTKIRAYLQMGHFFSHVSSWDTRVDSICNYLSQFSSKSTALPFLLTTPLGVAFPISFFFFFFF